MSCDHEMCVGVVTGTFFIIKTRISILCKNIPKYELFVRTQKIFSGSTIVSAWIGAMSTSHHSSIVAQYHHSRTKLYILAMDLIASTVAVTTTTSTTTTPSDAVDNGFNSAVAVAAAPTACSGTDECEFRSLFVVRVGVDATTTVAVVPVLGLVVIVVVVSSIKNN